MRRGMLLVYLGLAAAACGGGGGGDSVDAASPSDGTPAADAAGDAGCSATTLELDAAAAITVPAWQSVSLVVSMNWAAGTPEPLTLTVTGLPAGVVVDVVEVAPPATQATVTFEATQAPAAGTSTVMVQAAGACSSATTPVDLTVAASPGSLDPAFGTGGFGVVTGLTLAYSSDLGVHPTSGAIALSASQSTADMLTIRFTSAGVLDPTFSSDGVASIPFTGADYATGRGVVWVGTSTVVAGFAVADPSYVTYGALDADGEVDGALGGVQALSPPASTYAYAHDIGRRSDGNLMLAGTAEIPTTTLRGATLLRLGASGSPDASFGSAGWLQHPVAGTDFEAIEVLPDDRAAIAGTYLDGVLIARVDAAGDFDASYGNGGLASIEVAGGAAVYAMDALPDGRIAVCGQAGNHFMLLRFTTAGVLDSTFDGDGMLIIQGTAERRQFCRGVAFLADGRILTTGGAYTQASQAFEAMIRVFAADGALDAGFGDAGMIDLTSTWAGHFTHVGSIAVLPGDSVLIAGEIETGPSMNQIVVMRLQL